MYSGACHSGRVLCSDLPLVPVPSLQLFLAGRAAEEVFYGRDVTEYKPMDLMDATALARKIIVQ